VVNEIEADAKKFGDDRRTLIEVADKVTQAEAKAVLDEPVTIIVSRNGWLRSRQGHDFDVSTLSFKEGDALLDSFRTRTTATIALLDTAGRAYSVPATTAPGGRGDGAPVTSLIEMQGGAKIACVYVGLPEDKLLVAGDLGYGFVCSVADLSSRGKAGKAFLTLDGGERPLAPLPLGQAEEVVALSSDGRALVFPVADVKVMAKGKGVKLIEVSGRQRLTTLATVIDGATWVLKPDRLAACRSHRGGKGRKAR
jgi:topoisomerase-4 subunit A